MADVNVNDAPITTGGLFDEPYNALLPKFQALAAGDVQVVNLDIPSAVTTVLGVTNEVAGFKDQIGKELPLFDVGPILQLESYAMALSHAHTLFAMASAPVDSLAPMVDEGTTLRETLLADATALVTRNMLNGQQLRDLSGPVGYKNLAFDLQILAALFRENMAQLAGKCATQPAEIQRAEEISASILRTVGLREQGPASIAATQDMRARAFTLFAQVYDQARRAISYLRWNEEDADTVAPSLYAGRGNGRKKPDPTPPAPGPVVNPPAPVPAPPAPVPPVTAAQPAATNGSHKAGAAGTPSADPFVS
jgi:hypothetical protein